MTTEIIVPFSYASIPAGVASELKTTADTIRRLTRQMSIDIITVGNNLIAAKRRLEHGQLGPWLEAEFAMTERTARRYMQVAETFAGKSDTVSVLPPTALYMLASPSTPETVKATVIGRLEGGEIVSTETVQRLVREAKPTKLPVQDDEPTEESPSNHRTAFLLRADQSIQFATYTGDVTAEIVSAARAVSATWANLAERAERDVKEQIEPTPQLEPLAVDDLLAAFRREAGVSTSETACAAWRGMTLREQGSFLEWVDEIAEDHSELTTAATKKRRRLSRSARWSDAVSRAADALQELQDIQQSYEEWRDGLPENLQSGVVAEKLEAVTEIDFGTALEAVQDAEGVDLPLGFGRD